MENKEQGTALTGVRTSNTAPTPVLASFIEYLVRNQVITKDQAIQATEWKRQNETDKRPLLEVLKEEFGVSADQLGQHVAQYYAFRTIEPRERHVRRLLVADAGKIIRALPDATVQLLIKHKLLPFDLAENQPDKLVLITPNPADREIHELARAFPHKKFEICYMRESDWTDYLQKVLAEREKTTAEPVVVAVDEPSESDFESLMEREVVRAQLHAQLGAVLEDAIRGGATEIHIAPRAARKTEILFRIEGRLAVWHTIDNARCEAVLYALKGLGASMDRFERLAAQQGVIMRSLDNRTLRFTVSILPLHAREQGVRAESAVIHVMREAEGIPPLDRLGMDDHSLLILNDALASMRGLIVVAGPARSGKTTTIASALRSLIKPTLNIITVEEPVEFLLDGVRQVKLNPRLGYLDAIDLLTDHDPDVVMLGEIRSPEVANIALRLANIGHLVLSTMAARDTTSAVMKLIDMTHSPLLVGEGIRAVLAQQAVRLVCDRCKKTLSASATQQALTRLRFTLPDATGEPKLFRAAGCIDCLAGYRGHELLFEAFSASPAIREIIAGAAERIDYRTLSGALQSEGLVSLRQKALDMVCSGVTSVDELLPFVV